jgi:hypothetical protein
MKPPNRVAFYYGERVMNMEQKKPEITEERIRQIVREEIAAHEERRHQEVTEFLAATEGLVRGTSESRL